MRGSLVRIFFSAGVLCLVFITAAVPEHSGQSEKDGPFSDANLYRTRQKVKNAGTNATITICHATMSQSNPFETITVSDNGVAHQNHVGDIIPTPAGGCPSAGTNPAATPEPLTMLLFGAGLAGVGYAARRRR